MKSYFYTLVISVLATLLLPFQGKAQDVHFSQFTNSPFNLNPALTGVFPGDIRFVGNYRSQWDGSSIPVPFRTFSAGFDYVKYPGWQSNTRFGFGLVFNHDFAGDSKLTNNHLAGMGSLTLQLSQHHFITAGVQVGGFQRGFRTDELSFDLQYQDGVYSPSNPSGEAFDNNPTIIGFDFGAGFNWHYQARSFDPRKSGKRNKFDIGVGWYHINQARQSFLTNNAVPTNDADPVLPYRFSVYGQSVFTLDDDIDLLANLMWQAQGKYDQLLPMAGVRIHINQQVARKTALDLAVGYRIFENKDALIPQVIFHFRDWQFGLSYDVTLSEFNVANDYYGGPEVSVIYYIRRVVPDPIKICPIF